MLDDENAAQWNPANLALPSTARVNEDDHATSLGFQAGAEALSTNNFYRNSKDLFDFFEANQGSGIFNGSYTNSNRDEFFELIALVRNLEGDGQGALINATAGFNSRHTNWSVSVNNITDLAGYPQIDLTGGLKLGDPEVRDAFGNGTATPSGSPSSNYQDVADACEASFNDGSWSPSQFGITTSKSDMADFIASYAESNNVSESQTKKFCESGNKILNQSAPATSTNNTFDTEAQRVVFEGASINEASLSYSHSRPVLSLGTIPVYLGGSLRFMQGEVAYVEENPFNTNASDSTDEVLDEDEDIEESSNVGVDLGITLDAREALGLKVGLVGKYLNSPEFDYPDTHPNNRPTLTVDPQFRIGVSGYPLDFIPPYGFGRDSWQVTVDYDITKNETLLNGYEKQYLAIGNEFNVVNSFWMNLALRAGVRKNLAESREGRLYTGGVGVRVAGFNVEVSGVVSDETTKDEDGDKQPTLVGGSFNLAYRF